jgi:hypothetical protein
MNESSFDVRLREAYNFLSQINKEAYKDVFLLSNQVLSKNPYTNNFLKRFLAREKIAYPSLCCIVSKLLNYYVESAKKFTKYILEFIIYSLSFLNLSFSKESNELILISTFFIVRAIKESSSYEDLYFPGLRSFLEKRNKHYAYLPMFGGAKTITEFRDSLEVLKKEKIPVLSEYQILSLCDVLHVFYFILAYPFHVFRFLNNLRDNTYEIKLLKSEVFNTIDLFTFDSFARYLLGRRIATLPYKSIKVISWYENQVIDKNLYKGLRDVDSRVKVYGAQLFLSNKKEINTIPDENEEAFGLIPDKIIVNGPIFVPQKTRWNYFVGPSLRNAKIFSFLPNSENRENLLVLLPYSKKELKNVLQLVSSLKISTGKIFIKAHPAVSIQEIKGMLPENGVMVEGDIYKLFEITKIVIGSASGTLVEAASLGIPSVLIKDNEKLDFNPFPDYGKGIIWEDASTPEELICHIRRFSNEKDPEKINSVANEYKKMFFCMPTEENIIKAFDL